MQRLRIPETYDQAQLEAALRAVGLDDLDRIVKVVLKPDVLEVTVLIRRAAAYTNVAGKAVDGDRAE